MFALSCSSRDFGLEKLVERDVPHVVAPHGREHQEVRDEHEGDGEEDDFNKTCKEKVDSLYTW